MKTFTEQLNYAKARGPLAEWPEVSDAISLAFNQVMTGEKAPRMQRTQHSRSLMGL